MPKDPTLDASSRPTADPLSSAIAEDLENFDPAKAERDAEEAPGAARPCRAAAC